MLTCYIVPRPITKIVSVIRFLTSLMNLLVFFSPSVKITIVLLLYLVIGLMVLRVSSRPLSIDVAPCGVVAVIFDISFDRFEAVARGSTLLTRDALSLKLTRPML